MKKIIALFISLVCVISAFSGCRELESNVVESPVLQTSEPTEQPKEAVDAQPTEEVENDTESEEVDKMEHQFVEIELENGGKIVIETLPEYAPLSVGLFLDLVNDKYYDGLVFHRAVEGFMIQGGSPNGDGIGGSGTTVKGEFASNGVKNDLKHTRGVVSMARTMDKNSASGQFFIMHDVAPHLDGDYAAFGKVVEGMEFVDEIATSPVRGDTLINKPVMKSVKILKNYQKVN